MQDTRIKLLNETFQEMYRHGFKGMRIDVVLDRVGVAKGALYHHFKSKTELGYAVVDEVIHKLMIDKWIKPFEASLDPLEGISKTVRSVFMKPSKKVIEMGCPLNNLAQEMSSVDEGFRHRVDRIYDIWREAIASALKKGQDSGLVKKDIQSKKVATYIVASMAGCLGAAKNARNAKLLKDCGESLINYLESLRKKNS